MTEGQGEKTMRSGSREKMRNLEEREEERALVFQVVGCWRL